MDARTPGLSVAALIASRIPATVLLLLSTLIEKLVEPKDQNAVDLELSFPTGGAGSHAGRLHLTDSDRLMMDQDFLFAYATGRPASALILERAAHDDQKGTGLFLRAALQPQGYPHALPEGTARRSARRTCPRDTDRRR